MLGDMSQKIAVLTMEQALAQIQGFDVIIIDEADECLLRFGSILNEQKRLCIGFWDLLNLKTYLLTATAT